MNSIRSPHLHLTKILWKDHLKKGDTVLDATCGNGHDTFFLAQNVLTPEEGHVLALDIQKIALQNAQSHLKELLDPHIYQRVSFREECHSNFQTEEKFHLITYNLGYLPGADKSLTTKAPTTLASLKHAQKHLHPQGAISLVCYPGHSEGRKEYKLLLEFTSHLDPNIWNISHHAWINRLGSPALIWMSLRS